MAPGLKVETTSQPSCEGGTCAGEMSGFSAKRSTCTDITYSPVANLVAASARDTACAASSAFSRGTWWGSSKDRN